MGFALKIRDDLRSLELRRWACREARGRSAARADAIANAFEGMARAAAARLVGMDRQALRDAVVRYNAEGVEGLRDRPRGHPRLTADEEAALAAVIIAGPDPERDGVCAWTRADLCRWLPICAGGWRGASPRLYHPSSMTRVLRRMGFSRQKARPAHRQRDAEAQERFKKGGFTTSRGRPPPRTQAKRLQLWF